MLTLTENATTIVKTIAEQSETAGIRITGQTEPEPGLAIATSAEATDEDTVVEQDGATVYLDATAAEQLDDKVLDAGVDDNGGVQFALGEQQA
ncbi:hypothetical protein KUV85_05205 [Nocardioides panacisoli]|uniref:hypothetical protein n=1 Tax=Nocardioides panacisoli TaxID=627624 RepID=UPI001C634364|nr:hypothetical protein [Nocardioides panacisoli]QYJ05085.1 hypothetical protein KUV85_05205 [Nocardioides panacisoli]